MTFLQGLLIGHLHGPAPHVDDASPYNAYYYDDLPGSTLYREDLPTYHHALQQYPENLDNSFNIGQSQSVSSYQGDYVGFSYSTQNDGYAGGSISNYQHDDHYHDHHHSDHQHNDHDNDHHLVSDTYTG